MTGIGHNSGAVPDELDGENRKNEIGNIAGVALRQFVERIERLEEEKSALSADIKDVYAQLKSQGFDPKITRKLIQRRKMDRAEREEMDQILDLYEVTIDQLI